MQPSLPNSPPCAPQVRPSFAEPSPCSSNLIAPATSSHAAVGISNACGPQGEGLITDTWVHPRLLSFLQREPSVFTPWNPLPQPEEEDRHAPAEADSGENSRLGNRPILPFLVDGTRNIASDVEEERFTTLPVRCQWCLEGVGYLSPSGQPLPVLCMAPLAHYLMCCAQQAIEMLNLN